MRFAVGDIRKIMKIFPSLQIYLEIAVFRKPDDSETLHIWYRIHTFTEYLNDRLHI